MAATTGLADDDEVSCPPAIALRASSVCWSNPLAVLGGAAIPCADGASIGRTLATLAITAAAGTATGAAGGDTADITPANPTEPPEMAFWSVAVML